MRPKKPEYQLWVKDHGETIEDADLYESPFSDPEYIATEYAEYFHDNRDGWEASWPIVFSVAKDGQHLADVSVDRESRPHFYASKVDFK